MTATMDEKERESIKRRIFLAFADPEEYAGKRGSRGWKTWNTDAVCNALDPIFSALREGRSLR